MQTCAMLLLLHLGRMLRASSMQGKTITIAVYGSWLDCTTYCHMFSFPDRLKKVNPLHLEGWHLFLTQWASKHSLARDPIHERSEDKTVWSESWPILFQRCLRARVLWRRPPGSTQHIGRGEIGTSWALVLGAGDISGRRCGTARGPCPSMCS